MGWYGIYGTSGSNSNDVDIRNNIVYGFCHYRVYLEASDFSGIMANNIFIIIRPLIIGS
jgi:hypothetical protein